MVPDTRHPALTPDSLCWKQGDASHSSGVFGGPVYFSCETHKDKPGPCGRPGPAGAQHTRPGESSPQHSHQHHRVWPLSPSLFFILSRNSL